MDYLPDPTQIIYTAICAHPAALKSLQQWWDEPLIDAYGLPVPQNKAERIEGIQDWFFCQAEEIIFKVPFMGTIFDMLTDDVNWEELELLLHEGSYDED